MRLREVLLDPESKQQFTNKGDASKFAVSEEKKKVQPAVTEKIEQIREFVTKRQKTLASFGLCFLAIFMAYQVITANNGIKVYFHKRTENRTLQKEVEQLKTENEQLAKRVSSLKTDPQTIEKEAREQLKYTKPGEVVFVSREQQSQPKPRANATAQNK